MHLIWFPPPTRAAISLQPRLVHPPPISWPWATTTTPPQSTLSRFFAVSPVKTGMHSKIFDFLCTGPAPTPPTPPAHYSIAWGDHPSTCFGLTMTKFLLIFIDFVVSITFWAYHPPISSPPPII